MEKKGILALVKRTFSEWNEDEAPRLAASLAYYAIFSAAPLLLIAISVAGLVFGRQAAQGQIMGEIQGLVGETGARGIEEMLQNANKPASGILASIIGFAVLLFGASGVMTELQAALNRIWEAPAKPHQGLMGMLRDRFFSFTMVLALGFLLLVSLIASAAVAATGKYLTGLLPAPEFVLQALNFLISFAFVTLIFAVIFRYVPDKHVPWRDVWLGAVVTALLFNIGKFALGLYLGKGSFASAYGAAASIVIFLTWAYYSSQILFFGAEFTQVWSRRRAAAPAHPQAERERRVGQERRRGTERRGRDRRLRPMAGRPAQRDAALSRGAEKE
jgi:membrane protein